MRAKNVGRNWHKEEPHLCHLLRRGSKRSKEQSTRCDCSKRSEDKNKEQSAALGKSVGALVFAGGEQKAAYPRTPVLKHMSRIVKRISMRICSKNE